MDFIGVTLECVLETKRVVNLFAVSRLLIIWVLLHLIHLADLILQGWYLGPTVTTFRLLNAQHINVETLMN